MISIMSCIFNDLIVIEKAKLYIAMNAEVGDMITDEQKATVAGFQAIIDELHPITVDDEIAAVQEALIEIRDRDAD